MLWEASIHLRDCYRQDDWHPMSNYELWIIMNYIICKPIQSCPTWTHYFFLFNYYWWTYMVTPMHYHRYYFVCSTTLPYYIWKSIHSHATFLLHTLILFLYLHIYMIMCLMYDIFILLYALFYFFLFLFFFFFMYYIYDTDICIYVFYIVVLDHLKSSASH